MGQITIEIPQEINRHYKIVSEDSAAKFLLYLEKLVDEGILEEITEKTESEK